MNAVLLRHYVVRYERMKARAVIENHAAEKYPGLWNHLQVLCHQSELSVISYLWG